MATIVWSILALISTKKNLYWQIIVFVKHLKYSNQVVGYCDSLIV